MKHTYLLTATLLLVASVAAYAEVTVRPIGLVIGSPMIADMDFSFQPNGVNAGTSAHVLVTGIENTIVKLDDDNSTLDKVTDSTGKDLLKERPANTEGFSFSSSPIGPFPKISEDGTQLIVELVAPQTPAPGATSISFEGKLSVLVAQGRKTVSAQGITPTPGQVQLGDNTLEITGYGPSDWEEGKSKLSLRLGKPLFDAIATWKITGPDSVELSNGPYSIMTSMDVAEVELTLEKATDTINIELELFDGLKTIEIPVTTEVGLGIK